MRTVTSQGHRGMLMAELRAMRPGEVLLARGYRVSPLRTAVLAVEQERRTERLLFAMEGRAGRAGSHGDRYVVCGMDPAPGESKTAVTIMLQGEVIEVITDPLAIEALFAADFEAEEQAGAA